MIRTISPQELHSLRKSGNNVDLLDVRTPVEFREVHVDFAHNAPLDRLDPPAIQAERGGRAGEPLYLICRSGSRGKTACEKFLAAGIENVINVEGGTLACEAAGLPVVRGPKAISLDRQVRIAAGLLVLLGAALGFWVHPYWIGLSAFVGAGLVFAGVTDTCGMALLLGRMPWNQVSPASAACKASLLVLAVLALPSTLPAADHTTDSLQAVAKGVAEMKAVLIDVREQDEWDDGHLRDARLLPLSVLERGVRREELQRLLPPGKVVYLHCAFGSRCLEAAKILRTQGYDVRPLKPGYQALRDTGFPAAK